MSLTKQQLKFLTLSRSLFTPTPLREAVQRMKFIQIDPIRFPAPAQDLILRQRVKDYHVGDIDLAYQDLELEEDFLYAHGYMTRDVLRLLHPRTSVELTEFDKQVLATVQGLEEIHPKELDNYFEKKREVNWWGGYSRSSKMALDRLHYYGFLRVVRREKGLRIYQAFSLEEDAVPVEERLKKIVQVMIEIMAPVAATTLSQSLHRIHRHFGSTKDIISDLVRSGEVIQKKVDGVSYLWLNESLEEPYVHEGVKFLAPFDPVVRDRIRFEHLWGWLYQFEAYVPAAKRVRGYYAMPVLWNEDMVGWANVKRIDQGINVDVGFVDKRPLSKEFESQLEEEIERMKRFLQPNVKA